MQLYDLMTNKMVCPILDETPYFSWKIESGRQNVRQRSYRIEVFSEETQVWDSREIQSDRQSFIPYEGPALAPDTAYRWSVCVTCDDGDTASAASHFETAAKEWLAQWIGSSIERVSAAEYKYGSAYPAVLFEKRFDLPEGVCRARLRATAYGVYHLTVNGMRPDDREFAPEFTSYQKVLYYQTYDVTALLRSGENIIGLLCGDGWYFSQQAGPVTQVPVEKPAVLFQLDVELSEGGYITIASDGNETCATGSILYSDLFQGEKQDMRRDYTDKHPVEIKDYGYSHLQAQPMPPIRPLKLLPAVDVFTTPAGETVVDFGQVIAGRARIHVDIPEGTAAVFEYFEILDRDGNYVNTMFAPQKDTVISDGEAFLHEAVFTFHGFRYIRVSGIEHPRKEDFTAVLLTTMKENAGEFECSDAGLNRLYQNIRWSQYNNMMSVPTDCPSREKAGWTGDILIYAKTALQNENVTPFLTSWLRNLRADQADDGAVMITAPFEKLYQRLLLAQVKEFGDNKPTGVAGWSDAIVWVPYDMYRVTGNELVLLENYEAMKLWCAYILRTARERRGSLPIPEEYDRWLWNTGFHFGEWLIPSQPVGGFEICKESSYYIAPFFGYMTMRKMADIAEVIGRPEDRRFYASVADQMKNAIQHGLMEAGHMPEGLMGAYVIAFAFDLVPEHLRAAYAGKLVSLIGQNGGRLDTGFLATRFLLDALEIIGRPDLAHAMLWQDRMPSWLYEVDHGATAIWEAWNADEARTDRRFVSFDHYAFGCVDDWIMRRICGIDTDTPGYRHLVIAPQPDRRIHWCRRRLETEAGTVEVFYQGNALEVTIPCNASATVRWAGTQHEIGSGHYRFEGDKR